MNRLPIEKRAQIVGMLVEGMSLRAVSRLADCSINTITKLLVDVGTACVEYQDSALRNLACKRIQCDEIWSFVYAKEKSAPADMKSVGAAGDIWTWTAIDVDTKLMAAWMVGNRTAAAANVFMNDLAERLTNRVQLTTDGHKAALSALREAFDHDIDYAMLVKLYGGPETGDASRRYSPSKCTGTIVGAVSGNPDQKHISTSYVERQNLTMRMHLRRFTCLTNGFSKKVANHMHALSLHFMFYNFGKVHKTLRVTPAMAAGSSDHVWSLAEIAALVPEPVAAKRGPNKK